MKNIKNVLWGVLLIAIGVIVGLNTFEIMDINLFFDGWWTFLIIIPCTFDLFKSRNKTFDVIGIVVGVILLLVSRDILTIATMRKLLVPLIFVCCGFYLVFKDAFGGQIKDEINRLNKNRGFFPNKGAAFTSESVRYDNQVFEGIDLSAAFGSVTCDLRNAVIQHDVVINANATFGSIDIFVPPYVRVVVKSTSIFGGVSDKTTPASDVNAPKVYVNSVCLFGGVDVK